MDRRELAARRWCHAYHCPDDVASVFTSFIADTDRPVVIRIVPGESGQRRIALLNGFEIDGSDPTRRARKPAPAHDEEHVDGDAFVHIAERFPRTSCSAHRHPPCEKGNVMPAGLRSEIVDPDVVAIYHCWARCVRRAWLCGVDPLTEVDYE